jgi:hypothetical protein
MSYIPQEWRYDSKIYGLPFLNTMYLCGGMSFSSLDYCKKSLPVPPQLPIPAPDQNQRDKMRNYLYWYLALRQAESFLNGMLDTMFSCMIDQRRRNTETLNSLNALINNKFLRFENPIVLNPTDPTRPWENHKVLAYTIEQVPPNSHYIFAYDPNQSRTVSLRITATKTASGSINLQLSTLKPLYGFFINNSYNARTEAPKIPYPLP